MKQTKYKVMMSKAESTKIITYLTPRLHALGRGYISHIVKMHFSYKNLLLYSQRKIRQTIYVVMRTKEGSTKIVNFMTPRSGVLALGRGYISHIVKMHFSYKNLLLYSQA